jgi:hypothetical protein
MRELLVRAEQGDASALPRLRVLLAGESEIWRRYADLGVHLESELVRLAAGANQLMRECLVRKLNELRKDLAGAQPTPLIGLLAKRVSLGWLEAHYLDTVAAQHPDLTGQRLTELLRRRQAADRRYLGALKTLATIKRLVGKIG